MNNFDNSYHDMLRRILNEGIKKEDRTGTGTLSVFGHFQKFDLSEGFPLITTKRVWLKGIIHELLWMLSGSSNVKYLQDNGVKIWNDWADENGDLGPVYGSQWIRWGETDDSPGINQISNIVNALRSNPWSRRIMLSAWNVSDLDSMNLPPCHFNAQFNVSPKEDGITPDKLNCLMNIRSWDTFLGGPFNIAQYALLTMMLAQVAGLNPGNLCICSGDTHIYLNHIEQVRLQLTREPRDPPKIIIDTNVEEIEDFRYEHFKLVGYNPHPRITGEISV